MPALMPAARDGALELRLAEAEARNDELAREVATLRGVGGGPAMPAGVAPGRCYAQLRGVAAAQGELLEPERQAVRITPAVYEWAEEQVLTREARVEYEVVPAVVETVYGNVLISDGYVERTVMPALYEEVQAPAPVREAYVRWRACPAYVAAGSSAVCAVEESAVMGAATERRLVQPERVRETEIPARYMRVRRELVRSPAQLVTREIPAEYETVRVQRLVSPAREEAVTLPAVYAQVEGPAGAADAAADGWVEVLCDTPGNREVVRAVQRALAAAGHDPGPADGVFGPRTRAAMLAYQRAERLPAGHLTRATAQRLGVAWP
jgi:hypothetical protein